MPVGRIEDTALFKLFWKTDDPELAFEGLNETSREGAQKLAEFAKTHELDGTPSPAGAQQIGPEEQEVITRILQDAHYGDYWLQDARDTAVELFGLPQDALNLPTLVNRPKASRPVELQGTGSRRSARELGGYKGDQLPQALKSEYEQNKRFYEDPTASQSEKGRRALGLFKSYAEALWSRGQTENIDAHGSALLDAFFTLPYAKVYGTSDMNGFGVGAAQAMALGMDPFKFAHRFPDARPAEKYTNTSLNGALAPDMKYADDFREAKGMPRLAEKFEKASFLGPMIGEEGGNTKAGNLTEKTPFRTSGLNWGKVLFPGDQEIASAPPLVGFEFPIDCLDAYNNTIYMRPGEKLVVIDATGLTAEQILSDPSSHKKLTAEKVLEKDAEGKVTGWSAKFVNAEGQEVPPSSVLGLIVSTSGTPRGDGSGGGVASMGWFGKCHNYTAQKVFKALVNAKEFDRGETIPVKANGKVIQVPRASAQKTFDVYVQNLLPYHTMSGYRFNNEPQQLVLKSGERITGRVKNTTFAPNAGSQRVGGDVLAFNNSGDNQPPFNQELEVQLRDGRTRKIPAADVRQILVEMEKSTRLTRFLGFVSENRGVYATDASTGIIVSNGARFVNDLELDQHTDATPPEWAASQKDLFAGDQGAMEFQEGDKIVWARGKYSYTPDAEPTSTAFSGWYQVRDGRIVNEKFLSGEPDFAWSAKMIWDWTAKSSDHPHVPAEYVMSLFINGYKEMNDEIAKQFQLPQNWRDYRVREDAIPTTPTPPAGGDV